MFSAYDLIDIPVQLNIIPIFSHILLLSLANGFLSGKSFVRFPHIAQLVSPRILNQELPLLINLYTAGLQSVIPIPCRVLQFSDDFVVYVSDNDFEYMISVMNQTLALVSDWLRLLLLKVLLFSLEKTSADLPSFLFLLIMYTFHGKNLSKYMGVTLDFRLK